MESLDRVISAYNGIWPEFDWDSNDNNQNAIVETIQVWYHEGEDKYHEVGEISKGGTAVDRAYCKVVCTKEQFEKRVIELIGDQQMTNWYDYNNQEMVSLPPVGEIVLICNSEDKVLKVKILEHTNNGTCDIAVCRVISDFDPNLGRLGYYQNFFPSDWRKDEGKNKLIDKISHIIWQNTNDLEKDEAKYVAKQLYNLGYLKLPEDK